MTTDCSGARTDSTVERQDEIEVTLGKMAGMELYGPKWASDADALLAELAAQLEEQGARA